MRDCARCHILGSPRGDCPDHGLQADVFTNQANWAGFVLFSFEGSDDNENVAVDCHDRGDEAVVEQYHALTGPHSGVSARGLEIRHARNLQYKGAEGAAMSANELESTQAQQRQKKGTDGQTDVSERGKPIK